MSEFVRGLKDKETNDIQYKGNAFLHCVLNFFLTCRKLFHTAAVYNINLLRTKTQRTPENHHNVHES